ncbi:MAG: acyltransferase family protein [Pseudolabrys sp.]|nr:acyltransferase family protein [Pseudolabrys sp.]MBV9954275.1 acyltransferase family protein [Pseudolabrys sp.]
MVSASTKSASGGARRTDLDIIRIVICAAVILAHALLIFAAEPRYHLKAPEWYPATVSYEFMRATTMAVFFLVAGLATVMSLRGRSVKAYVSSRINRILVPLFIGIVTLGPVIKYIELSHGRNLSKRGIALVAPLDVDFLHFLPLYFTHSRLVTWSHLWFLAYLFAYSIVFLPIMVWLARRPAKSEMPPAFVVYLPGLLLAAQVVAFNGYWPFLPTLFKDPNTILFALCFLLGAMFAVWPGFEARLRQQAVGMVLLLAAAFSGIVWFGESLAGRVCVGLTAWAAVGASLALGARYAPPKNAALDYLAQATLPIYIVHHVPLLLIALAILPLAIPVLAKIAVIAGLTMVVSLALYHFLIRPMPPVRWAVGMPAR